MDAPVRVMVLLRAGVGAALMHWPQRIASAAGGSPTPPLACLLTRVLGARQLVQATLELTAPGLLTPQRGALIDATHSATMLALAGLSPRHRRIALVSAVLAAILSGFGVFCARHTGTQNPGPRLPCRGLGPGQRSSVDPSLPWAMRTAGGRWVGAVHGNASRFAPPGAPSCPAILLAPAAIGMAALPGAHRSRLAIPGGEGEPQSR